MAHLKNKIGIYLLQTLIYLFMFVLPTIRPFKVST